MKKKKVTKAHPGYLLFSFIVFVVAFSLRIQGLVSDTLTSLGVIAVLFALGMLLVHKSGKKILLIDAISLGVVFLLSFVDVSSGLNLMVLGLGQLTLFAACGYFMMRIYGITLETTSNDYMKLGIIFLVSIVFAYFFLLLNEPFPTYIVGSILILIVYTGLIALSEELVFRGVSFSLFKRLFSNETALHLQAILFAVVHLLSISFLYTFFVREQGSSLIASPLVNVILYAVALYAFAIVAGRYAQGKKHLNIMYPIIFHWLVNFLNLLVLVFI